MERRDYDPAALGKAIYPVLTSVIVPRPIAWVSTRSADGVDNLAPHSFFTVSSVSPPVVQFTSVGPKDSLRNVRATGEFVVCIATEELADQVNTTATDYPSDMSEFDQARVTREPSAVVAPYRVAESPVAIECRLLDTRDFGGADTVVFGQVVHVSIAEGVLRDDLAAVDLLRPVARLGSLEWSTIGDVTDRRRVPYAEIASRP